MAIICFDYGHGGVDPGAVYRGRKEKDDNFKIGKLVAKRLRDFGIVVDETRSSDRTLSLKSRSDFERKKAYDYFLSFHRNAFKPEKARGVETYIYESGYKKAKPLASLIQKRLKDTGFVDRGVKEANFHVLRETKSPAILIELGFIDNTLDNEIFVKKEEKIVTAISTSILDTLGIKYSGEAVGDTYYRVLAGSFKSKENAKKRKKQLEAAGVQSVILPFKK
ncbi:MAG: N-acetylmuramoyl-L-alanine amidase [Tissierella sp.]|uniref:N-acetylmuramoyl-L-alanine amidase n=1 Tax=Tissierella sp. TaxID=41274 RepID=UPI003F9A5A5A